MRGRGYIVRANPERIFLMRKSLTKKLIFLCTMVLFYSSLYAAESSNKEAIQKNKVDFSIEKIYSHKCVCELPGLDVFYADKIIFTIRNNSGETEDVELVLYYYDISLGKERFVILKEKSLRRGEERNVVMLNRPVLIQKSIGATGTLGPLFPTFVEDTNKNNNKLIIYSCRIK